MYLSLTPDKKLLSKKSCLPMLLNFLKIQWAIEVLFNYIVPILQITIALIYF